MSNHCVRVAENGVDDYVKNPHCYYVKKQRLVEQGHLVDYVKKQRKETGPGKVVVNVVPEPSVNRIVNGAIEAIHGVTDRLAATRNFLRARLARA